jgi:P4 family phage/plasmid primase-like protien
MAVTIDELKESVKIEDVIAGFGRFDLRLRAGRYIKATNHESFTVDTSKQYYFWNAMGRGGSVLDYLIAEEGMDMARALEWLQRKTGLELSMSEDMRQAVAQKRKREESLIVIMRHLYKSLWKSDAAIAWGMGRGWSQETMRAAKCGFWDGNKLELLEWIKLSGIQANDPAVQAILQIPENMFAYGHWRNGRCEYVTFRAIEQVEARYKHRKLSVELVGQQLPYWNHVDDAGHKRIVVVEGQADALTLGQWGIHAVALTGLADNELLQKKLDHYEQIYLGLDNDPAGKETVSKLARRFRAKVRIVRWPEKDANEWLRAGGTGGEAEALLGKSKPFVLHLAVIAGGMSDGVDKETAIKEVVDQAVGLPLFDYALIRGEIAAALGMMPSTWEKLIKTVRDAQRERGETDAKMKMFAVNAQEKSSVLLTDDQKRFLQEASWDHEGHAECTKKLFGDRLAFVPRWGWVAYDGKKWQLDGGEHICQQYVAETIKIRRDLAVQAENAELARRCNGTFTIIGSSQSMLERRVLKATSDFNSDPDLLNCSNGVVDLRTGNLMDHDPKFHFMYCVDTEYHPTANDDDWFTFLMSVTGEKDIFGIERPDGDLLEWIQMAVGYSITGHTRENCLFYLHGATRSGKGTFTHTLLTMLGSPLSASVPFKIFTENANDPQNFTFAPLQPCRFIAGSEPNKSERFNDGLVKNLTGEDPMRCSFKGKDQFEFMPSFKIWLSSNWPFNADPSDTAVWGRARIIHFPNSFLGNEDKGLKQRLVSKEALEGVLMWAVKGAVAWYASPRGLQSPEAVKAMAVKQRLDQDYVQQFLDECCDIADAKSEVFTGFSEIHKRYTAWCHDNGVMPLQQRSLALALKAKGFMDSRKRTDGKLVRGYIGMQLGALAGAVKMAF